MKYIDCPDLTENSFVSFFTNIKNKVFKLTFRWNEYCDCCFLNIVDGDNNNVSTGIPLCNKITIKRDLRVLPEITFKNKNDLNYEPTRETIKDYRLLYEDSEE